MEYIPISICFLLLIYTIFDLLFSDELEDMFDHLDKKDKDEDE